jgi:hypothetical protein
MAISKTKVVLIDCETDFLDSNRHLSRNLPIYFLLNNSSFDEFTSRN